MPRISLLCFIDCDGLVESFLTDGTFDRIRFVTCCREFALSKQVQQHPGRRSVWILDGARIHCHPNITYYLRSIGIVPVFLPAYCPFFNPIEYMFGYVKRLMCRNYQELSVGRKDLVKTVSATLHRFNNFSLRKVFKHCGYSPSGRFNPGLAYSGSTDMANFGFE